MMRGIVEKKREKATTLNQTTADEYEMKKRIARGPQNQLPNTHRERLAQLRVSEAGEEILILCRGEGMIQPISDCLLNHPALYPMRRA